MLLKGGECRTVQNHGGIEPLDEIFQIAERKEEPGLAQHARLDVGQGRDPVEMADDVLKAIEGNENRVQGDTGRVEEVDEDLPLVLDAPGYHGPKFWSFQ
jgi:hypothetical protein